MADQNNPWDTTPAADSAAQSADAWGTPTTAPTDGGGADWLTSTPAPNVEHFNILDPFHKTLIPLDSWVTEGIDWVVTHFRPVFQGVRVPVDYILNGFQQLLLGMPAPVAIIVFALIAWQISGVGMGVATLVSLIAIGAIGAWSQAMVTLALVLTACCSVSSSVCRWGYGWREVRERRKLFVHCLMPCRPRQRLFIWCQSSCYLVSVTCRAWW